MDMTAFPADGTTSVSGRALAVSCVTTVLSFWLPMVSDGHAARLAASQSGQQTAPHSCKQQAKSTDERIVTAGERNNGKEIALSPSETLEIRLPSVPGTGYGWKVAEPLPSFLCLDEQRLDLGRSSTAGAPATSIMRFVALGTGAGAIRLSYVRPWEKDVPPKKTYMLPVRVK
jgi:inhibitor of cysteine peptidase